MASNDGSLEEAMWEVSELLRTGEDFSLSVSCMDGVWQVSMTDYSTGIGNVGKGGSFAAAWHAREML